MDERSCQAGSRWLIPCDNEAARTATETYSWRLGTPPHTSYEFCVPHALEVVRLPGWKVRPLPAGGDR